MPTFISLPPEFAALEGKVQWVQQVNSNEYTSSCPNCGIDPSKHSDSHPSDRFVMWLESKVTGLPFGMCFRGCGWKWSPSKHDVHWTDEEKAVFIAKRKEMNERDEQRIKDYALNVVMKQRIYVRYIENMKKSEYGQMYLKERGFTSQKWNEYFGFGIFEDYKCRGYLDTYYAPAITMPIVGLGNIIEQIKLRVTGAHHDKDRFRNLYATKAQHTYFPLKDTEIKNKVAVFEGEMKSCMVAMRGNLPGDVTIVGTQGKGIGSRMAYKLEKADVIYLCLDPDAFTPNDKGETSIMQAARKFGYDRTRIILCKDKVDDAIRAGFNLRNAYNMAVKPIQLGLK